MDDTLVVKRGPGRPRKLIATPEIAPMAQTETETPTLTADEKFERLIAALTAKRDDGLTKDDLKDILTSTQTVTAREMQRAMKPENPTHPGKSVFNYPEGDEVRPKVRPAFDFFYNGYPCHKFMETIHWREAELMAQVQPGEYTVIRKDGTTMAVSVTAERDANQVITKLDVRFPVSREEKWLVPPMLVVLYQLVYPDAPRKRFVEANAEHMDLVFGAVPA